MSQAWHTAAFYRAQRLPSLATALGDEVKPKHASNDQMLASFRAAKRKGAAITIRKVA